MPTANIPIFVFAVIVAAVPAAAFGLARRAGRAGRIGSSSTECARTAAEPLAFEETERRSNLSQIYLVGALVVMCEVVIVFLTLWALRMTALGLFGLATGAGVLGVVACGYVWLYRNRALERL